MSDPVGNPEDRFSHHAAHKQVNTYSEGHSAQVVTASAGALQLPHASIKESLEKKRFSFH